MSSFPIRVINLILPRPCDKTSNSSHKYNFCFIPAFLYFIYISHFVNSFCYIYKKIALQVVWDCWWWWKWTLWRPQKEREKKWISFWKKKNYFKSLWGNMSWATDIKWIKSFFFGENKVLKYMYLFMPEMRFRIEFLTKFDSLPTFNCVFVIRKCPLSLQFFYIIPFLISNAIVLLMMMKFYWTAIMSTVEK